MDVYVVSPGAIATPMLHRSALPSGSVLDASLGLGVSPGLIDDEIAPTADDAVVHQQPMTTDQVHAAAEQLRKEDVFDEADQLRACDLGALLRAAPDGGRSCRRSSCSSACLARRIRRSPRAAPRRSPAGAPSPRARSALHCPGDHHTLLRPPLSILLAAALS